MKLFGTSRTLFALRQYPLLGLIVLASAFTLLGSALASRASAQEAWSGYLVIKASYRYSTAESLAKGNTKSAFYFDGAPESVVSDTGPGGTSRIWEQRVRWSGYIRESEMHGPGCPGRTNYRASGSGLGIAQIALFEQADVFPPPAGAYILDGGYDRQMQGTRVVDRRVPICRQRGPSAAPGMHRRSREWWALAAGERRRELLDSCGQPFDRRGRRKPGRRTPLPQRLPQRHSRPGS